MKHPSLGAVANGDKNWGRFVASALGVTKFITISFDFGRTLLCCLNLT